MKVEKLKNSHTKKLIIGVVSVSALILLAVYTGSRAKYKVTESIPLVNGSINYKPYDFKMMAMYQGDGSSGYTEIDTMPTGGYTINEEKSYCTIDNVNKDTTAKLFTNSLGQHVIENLKKNDKCYIWFDKEKVAKDTILAANTVTAGATSFTGVSISNEGLKSGIDDDGTTYYFRGAVTNNWVQFAGFYWRIIRINGDGSIRMIYNGTTTDQIGETTQIGTSEYNASYNDNAYIGYMYGATGASAYADTHSNTNNSTIKGIVDNWYKTNIADKGYSNKVSIDAGFCNDRKISTVSRNNYGTLGYGTNVTAYAPADRVYDTSWNYLGTQTPSFKCSQVSSDLFTVSSSTKGNKKLTYPVGLITTDEVVFAGGFGGTTNSSYYLYTNQVYWTMTPSYFAGGYAVMFYVLPNGGISGGYVSRAYGVRLVINLASDVKLTGNGTTSDPYKVV